MSEDQKAGRKQWTKRDKPAGVCRFVWTDICREVNRGERPHETKLRVEREKRAGSMRQVDEGGAP